MDRRKFWNAFQRSQPSITLLENNCPEEKEEAETNELLSTERAGTTLSGLVGGGFTLLSAMLLGMLLRRKNAAN